MIVIADTSPICYLVLIDQIDLLPQLYGQIIIPTTVPTKLQSPNVPPQLQQWISQSPSWLIIQPLNQPSDPALSRLDPGEQAAIALAEQLNARLLIIDERAGRQIAQQRQLSIIGLIGILDEAATLGLIHLPTVIDRLKQTTFRISPHLLNTLLQKHSPS
jgi:predicted nucleic acid-binding protein